MARKEIEETPGTAACPAASAHTKEVAAHSIATRFAALSNELSAASCPRRCPARCEATPPVAPSQEDAYVAQSRPEMNEMPVGKITT